jgi:tetratricopeptide (TPR) repeat protein
MIGEKRRKKKTELRTAPQLARLLTRKIAGTIMEVAPERLLIMSISRTRRFRIRTPLFVRWVSTIVAAVVVMWWAWPRLFPDPLAMGLAAYEQRAWNRAEAEARKRLTDRPGDLEAWRLLARSAGRQGRDTAAQTIFRQRLGFEAMTAEDFVIAAAGLMRQGQTHQARIALEKARARAPQHPEMLHDLVRFDAATDHLAEAAELAERLITRPGWEVRGWLLLGQVREKLDDPARTAEALQRAHRLDPDPMLGDMDSPPGSTRKRFARALLRTGRPAEARDQIAIVQARERDFEASWLLSRAWLQQGDIPAATAALAQSGGYGVRDPTITEPAPFVGAARCAECHEPFHRDQQSSRHARTFHQSVELEALPALDRPVADSGDADVQHVLRHEDGRLRWETTDQGRVMNAVVEYAFGSGHVAITLVGRESGGDSRELRLSHFGRAAAWDVTTGHLSQPADRHEFLGRDLGRDGVRRCLECHTTNARIASERLGPAATDRGIGCERCHGPGANHLAAVAGEFSEPAIARPRLATAEQIMALCATCHSPKDAKIVPGDYRAPRFASTSLAWSPCYTQSTGGLSCVSCHDPHRNAETSATYYEARCLTCHSIKPPSPSLAKRPMLRLPVRPKTMRRIVCTVNPANGCLKCHMPPVDGIVPHASFTDHYIRIRAPKKG